MFLSLTCNHNWKGLNTLSVNKSMEQLEFSYTASEDAK